MMNYLAILVVSIVSYIILALWYSPVLFGKLWMKLTKIKNMKMGPSIMILGLIFGLLSTTILSFIINSLGIQGFLNGAVMGATMWLGFLVPFMINEVFYEKRSPQLFLLNITGYLIILLVSGGILAIWQ